MIHFSEACERNKVPILANLEHALRDCHKVLEIGSGTAQHAIYFGDRLPHLQWQTSDVPANLDIIRDNLGKYCPPNVRQPLELDVRNRPWPEVDVDAVFSANTLHIMSWDEVVEFFRGAGEALVEDGTLCIYGPFRYNSSYTSDSNADFDIYLKMRDPASGIRDFENVNELAQRQGLVMQQDNAMPANNQLITWKREP
jgi:SAM-dependent methyltransferase